MEWSDEVCTLHDMPPGTSLSLAQAIDYYVPEYRPTIREHFRECAVDGTPFEPCDSPHSVQGLTPGEHTFEVRAIDLAGKRMPVLWAAALVGLAVCSGR